MQGFVCHKKAKGHLHDQPAEASGGSDGRGIAPDGSPLDGTLPGIVTS